MIVKNPWVGYLNRSYSSIKSSVLSRLKISAPEISDYSESNILIVIVGIFAGIGEMLNYYIDAMAREGFLETARKLASVTKIVKLINYRIKSSISASVDLTFTTSGETVLTGGQSITIPQNTVVTDANGIGFLTTRAGYITEGLYSITIPARQQQIVNLFTAGTASGAANQAFSLPSSYDDRTLYVKVGNDSWDLKEHFGFSGPTDQHVIVGITTTGLPYFQFGDDVNGAIPTAGSVIQISYRTTNGLRGVLPAESITTLVSSITLPNGISSLDVTNVVGSTGGLDVEGIERIRKSAPLSLRTLERAVTLQDYTDIAKLSPSVDKAKVSFTCGKVVTIYVSPIGGGIASSQILSDTFDYMDTKKISGLNLVIKPTGETYIGLNLVVTAKFRVNTNLVEDDIKKVLIQAYSSEKSDINKPIRTSDIIALIDNLEKVDFLDLAYLYAIPYARPVSHTRELSWTRRPGYGSTQELSWQLLWNGTNFILYSGDTQIQTLTLNTEYVYPPTSGDNCILRLTMLSVPGGAQAGDRWEFKTYGVNQDVVLNDYTVPRIHPSFTYIDLTVKEQSY